MKWRWLIPLVVIIFAWTLLMHAPAANLVAWFMPINMPVKIYGVTGTLHDGKIAALRYQNRPAINQISWSLHPLWLLTGRAALSIDAGSADPSVRGNLKLSRSSVHASHLVFNAHLKTLLATAGYSFMPVDGLLKVNVHNAGLTQTAITALDADLSLRSLRWDMGEKPAVLGNYTAHATRTDKGGIEVEIASTSGPINASGHARLSASGRYSFNLKLRPRPDAPKQVKTLLQGLGRPDSSGNYHLHVTGQSSWPRRTQAD